jgi:signal peptidase II
MTDALGAAEAAGPPRHARSPLPTLAVLAVGVVTLDQLTKHWALNALSDGGERHVIWTLQWNLAFNKGMAFSAGQNLGPVIGVVAILMVIAIAIGVRRTSSRLAAVAGGLVAGGALGNFVDRLFRGDGWLHGRVVDFIDFQWFPIFNVADIAVNIGGALFVLWSLFSKAETTS